MFTTHLLVTACCLLLTRLDSPRYAERCRAEVVLRAWTVPACGHLLAAEDHGRSEQVRSVARNILDGAFRAEGEQAQYLLPTNYDQTPWIDMLPEDYPQRYELQRLYLDLARAQLKNYRGSPHWDDYRLATRLYLRHLRSQRTPTAELQTLLENMLPLERAYIKRHLTPQPAGPEL